MSENPSNAVAAKKFEFHHKDAGTPSIIHVILLNRTLRILLSLGIFCMLIPLVDYFYFYSREIAEYQIDDSGICSHHPIYQIPCGSENTTEAECVLNACCFSPSTGCYHFLPSKYQLRHRPDAAGDLTPTRETSPLETRTFSTMKFDIQQINDEILSIALWSPQHLARSPVAAVVTESRNKIPPKYEIKVFKPEFFIEVKRKLDNRTIFSTARGALIASEDYFEWSFHLGTGIQLIAGFDELYVRAGRKILINNGHSSVMPYVVGFDSITNSYHAVHFESIDSPAEVQILKSNTIIIRQYASSSFIVKLFTGPSYEDVHRQLKSLREHYLPIDDQAWPFGIHLCHYSAHGHQFHNESETKAELDHLLANIESLPFDSHCIDADLTALVMSTTSVRNVLDGYETYVEKLRELKKKILLHVTLSAVEIDDEQQQQQQEEELFLKDPTDGSSNYVGIYEKSRKLHFLDYITKSKEIAEWLKVRWLNTTHTTTPDGFFLYRAYPFSIEAIDQQHKYLETFNFKPRNFQSEIEQLIPLNVKHAVNAEPLIHQLNNYGREQIQVFQQTLNNFGSDDEGKKFCIADSYREDSECGMLMRESKPPSWISFQQSIHKSIFYSLIGMSFFGEEVCGDGNHSIAEDLCIRSYQFAIFTPLFYVNIHRMPSKFTKYAQRLMVHAIRTRYSLFGYMQTWISMEMPLLRPLHLAYADVINESVSWQFMYGDSLMIAPIVEPLVTELNLTFPEKYFELWSGEAMASNVHFSIVMHDIPIFIRAGRIIALNLAHESLSIEEARMQPYLLIIALDCTEKFSCHASGIHKIFLPHRRCLEFKFEASEKHLNITTTLITTAAAVKEEENGEVGGRTNPNSYRDAICGPKPFASSEFRLAKIYGLGEFKEKYRNDYLSLDLNICNGDANDDDDGGDWNGRNFTISI